MHTHTSVLMYVAAAQIQDEILVATSQRQAREARRSAKAAAVQPQRRLGRYLRRAPAPPLVPTGSAR